MFEIRFCPVIFEKKCKQDTFVSLSPEGVAGKGLLTVAERGIRGHFLRQKHKVKIHHTGV